MVIEVKAFLDLLAWSEGTSSSPLTRCSGYDVIVSGPQGPEIFTDFSRHPFVGRSSKLVRPGLRSTASGRYQVLRWVCRDYTAQLHLADFGPASQDAIAVQQLLECKALPLILKADAEQAILRSNHLWASLPGNGDGQGGHSMSVLLDRWAKLYKPSPMQEAA